VSKYLENVKQYVPSPVEDAVDSLVGHLGIALDTQDGSNVAATDPEELKKIRAGYCSINLDLDGDEAAAAIAKVCKIMEHDRNKCRVTFYYLLAQETDRMHRLC